MSSKNDGNIVTNYVAWIGSGNYNFQALEQHYMLKARGWELRQGALCILFDRAPLSNTCLNRRCDAS
jgi:hypothetical protein